MAKRLRWFEIILLCGLLILLSGCSKSLSENKAEAIIKDYLEKHPIVSGSDIIREADIENNLYVATPQDDRQRWQYLLLDGKGLLKLSYELLQNPGEHSRIFRRIVLTDKANKYILSQNSRPSYFGKNQQEYTVLLGVYKFNKIKGITAPSDAFGQMMCTVNFETKLELTPFGECLFHTPDKTQEHSLQFVLFNDGWRIMK